jgi:hypothetical protein
MTGYIDCRPNHKTQQHEIFQHNRENVPRKPLTIFNYCTTVIT